MAKKESFLNTSDAKRWLRRVATRKRQSRGILEQKASSEKIIKRLIDSPDFKLATSIASFIGFGSEVFTDGIIEICWKMGKNVLIPMTSNGLDQPFFVLFSKEDKLHRTKHGPLELVSQKKPFDFRLINLVLVPGLAFDLHGHRLGYGGGVYDRILCQTPQAKHIGLFYSDQEIHRVPKEAHDTPLHMIITETSSIRIKRSIRN